MVKQLASRSSQGNLRTGAGPIPCKVYYEIQDTLAACLRELESLSTIAKEYTLKEVPEGLQIAERLLCIASETLSDYQAEAQ